MTASAPMYGPAVITSGEGTLRGLVRRREAPDPRPSPPGNRTRPPLVRGLNSTTRASDAGERRADGNRGVLPGRPRHRPRHLPTGHEIAAAARESEAVALRDRLAAVIAGLPSDRLAKSWYVRLVIECLEANERARLAEHKAHERLYEVEETE